MVAFLNRRKEGRPKSAALAVGSSYNRGSMTKGGMSKWEN